MAKKSITVHRCFQRYSTEDRADMASSHRMGHVKRHAVGEFFYVSDLIPNIAFATRGQAERREQSLVTEVQFAEAA